jgi:protein-S-isoprenylcysteine O-methyltransferase Ste14
LAAMTFFAAKTTINPLRPARASTLVTTGVFSLSRNPIYLGDFLVLLALVVWFGNVINLLLLPLFVWFINRFQIAPEERALTGLFGDDYLLYCKNVRRWL